MAPATVPHAFWTPGDEDQLIDFFLDHHAAAGDGGNFEEVTFQALSALLTPLVTKGGQKTVCTCQNKWNAVHCFLYYIMTSSNNFLSFVKPSTSSRLSRMSQVGLGVMRLVLASLPNWRTLGQPMSISIRMRSHSNTRVGATSTRWRISCLEQSMVPMFFMHQMPLLVPILSLWGWMMILIHFLPMLGQFPLPTLYHRVW